MAIKVPDNSRQRLAPGASNIPTAEQAGFGQRRQRAIPQAEVPRGLFGDGSGDFAMGTALENAGNTILEIGNRAKRLREAEEDSARKQMDSLLSQADVEERLRIEKLRGQKTMSADEVLNEYNIAMEGRKNAIFKSYNFNTEYGNGVKEGLDRQQKLYSLKYSAGTVEKIRVANINAGYALRLNTIGERMQNTTDFAEFQKIKQELVNITTEPAYIASLGGEDQATLARNKKLNGLTRDFISNRIEVDASGTLEYLKADAPIEGLTDSQRQALIEDAENEILQDKARAKRQQAEFHKENEKFLIDGLLNGTLTNSQVESMYEEGKISISQYKEYRKALVARTKKTRKSSKAIDTYNNTLLNAQEGMLATDPRERNNFYEQELERDKAATSSPTEEDPQLNEQARAYSVRGIPTTIGINRLDNNLALLPSKLKRRYEASLQSSDPEIVKEAVESLVALEQKNPNFMDSFSEDTKAITGLRRSGMSINNVMETIKNNRLMTPEERKGKESQFKELTKKKNYNPGKFLEDKFDAEINFETTPAAKTRFNNLTESYFMITGNLEVAQQLAGEDIARSYGKTKLSGFGTEVVANRPASKVTGIPDDTLRLQLDNDLRERGVSKEELPSYRVIADFTTERQLRIDPDGNRGYPSYLIQRQGPISIEAANLKTDGTVPTGPSRWVPRDTNMAEEKERSLQLDIVELKSKIEHESLVIKTETAKENKTGEFKDTRRIQVAENRIKRYEEELAEVRSKTRKGVSDRIIKENLETREKKIRDAQKDVDRIVSSTILQAARRGKDGIEIDEDKLIDQLARATVDNNVSDEVIDNALTELEERAGITLPRERMFEALNKTRDEDASVKREELRGKITPLFDSITEFTDGYEKLKTIEFSAVNSLPYRKQLRTLIKQRELFEELGDLSDEAKALGLTKEEVDELEDLRDKLPLMIDKFKKRLINRRNSRR